MYSNYNVLASLAVALAIMSLVNFTVGSGCCECDSCGDEFQEMGTQHPLPSIPSSAANQLGAGMFALFMATLLGHYHVKC